MAKEKLEKNDEVKMVKRVQNILKYLEEYRFPQERAWWEIQNFIRGYHYHLYKDLKNTNIIDIRPVKLKTGQIRRTVNLFRKVYRDAKSMIRVANYNWSVMGGSEDNIEERYLHWYAGQYNVGSLLATVAGYGFKRSVGYAEVKWNSDEARCEINPRDPFTLYEDPNGQFFISVLPKRKAELESAVDDDGNYVYKNLEKLQSTTKRAQSNLYNHYLQKTFPTIKTDEKGLEEFMITELYEMKDGFLHITTICEDTLIREEKTELKEFPFERYEPESENELYFEPLLEPLLHPAKALNRTLNHIEEWIRFMQKGRYFVKSGQKFNEVRSEHGHIYNYDQRKPEAENVQALPATPFQFIDLMQEYHQLLTGFQVLPPAGVQSGKAMAFFQALSQQNATEPLENMKDFLRRLGKRILKMTSEKLASGQDVAWVDEKTGRAQIRRVVGSQGGYAQEEGLSIIKNPIDLTVEIIPGGAFARLNQKEEAKELYQLGLIGRKATLKEVAMGNLHEVIKEAEEEEARLAAMGVAPGFGATRGGVVGGGGVGGAVPTGEGEGSPAKAVRQGVKKTLPGRVSIKQPML